MSLSSVNTWAIVDVIQNFSLSLSWFQLNHYPISDLVIMFHFIVAILYNIHLIQAGAIAELSKSMEIHYLSHWTIGYSLYLWCTFVTSFIYNTTCEWLWYGLCDSTHFCLHQTQLWHSSINCIIKFLSISPSYIRTYAFEILRYIGYQDTLVHLLNLLLIPLVEKSRPQAWSVTSS